jgi:hypothetical protein
VYDSFDEFGFLDFRMRFVAPLKLGARQVVAGLERQWFRQWNTLRTRRPGPGGAEG